MSKPKRPEPKLMKFFLFFFAIIRALGELSQKQLSIGEFVGYVVYLLAVADGSAQYFFADEPLWRET